MPKVRRVAGFVSSRYESALTRTFACRVPEAEGDPRRAMLSVIRRLRQRGRTRSPDAQLQWFLRRRGIRTVIESEAVDGDGWLRPCGDNYRDGFDLLVKKSAPPTRRRFTLAHELCHTFFYEIVPEVKFTPHAVDPCEERVCDYGAAELLMPERAVRASSQGCVNSVSAIVALADVFHVSVAAMLIRLRVLSLSECELLLWYRSRSGEFLPEDEGGKKVGWRPIHGDLVERAWESVASVTGRTFLESTDSTGVRRVRPISYEALRQDDRVLFLWSRKRIEFRQSKTLFSSTGISW